MKKNGLKLLHVPSTQVLLLLQRMFLRRLRAEAGEAKEHSLQVGVVKTRHSSLRAEEGSQLFQSPRALDIHLLTG